ncbi:hypothetical protein ACHAQH_006371 [Verticillium albo-atrum]
MDKLKRRFKRKPHHVLEKNRQWHDPVIEIYDNLESPTAPCSVRAYDVANRRWYQLDVDAPVSDDAWLSSIVQKHVRAYHRGHRRQPRWNTIRTTLKGSPVAYQTQEEDKVIQPISNTLRYGVDPKDRFPTVQYGDIHDKKYLSKGADLCQWNGRRAVFKRIEFDDDVKAFERAIRIRERLIGCIDGQVDAKEIFHEMEQKFNVVPIHAVVIKDDSPGPWEIGTVAGIIMPFAGASLDALAQKGDVSVTESQLLDLTRGVKELNRQGIMHGDICDWNVTVQPPVILGAGRSQGGKLLLVDLGNVAPDYEGDAQILGKLLHWCLQHCEALRRDPDVKQRVVSAANILEEQGDFDAALGKLQDSADDGESRQTISFAT